VISTIYIFDLFKKQWYSNLEVFMSGGNYEYFYLKLQNFIEEVERWEEENPDYKSDERKKFKDVMKEASNVLKSIEWTDSGDSSQEATNIAIQKFFDSIKTQ
jgi:hypothetical protein